MVPIRVLLADDQPLIRAALVMANADLPDLEVVGEAGTGLEAVRLTRELRPDVAVMDLRMPGMDGIEATRMIAADGGTTRVMVLTTFDDDDNVYNALRAGASGFLVKDMGVEDILAAVRVVAAGDALLSPGVTRRLIERVSGGLRPAPDTARLEQLTEREREVLALVAHGLTNTEIGERLYLSPLTAKTHVSRIMTKLDARDRVHLVVLAYETGLVQPGWQ